MVYALTQKKESGIMPIYGQTPPPNPTPTSKLQNTFSWINGVKGNWDQQAGPTVNNQTSDQSRLTLPVRSGRWNASRRDW